MKFTNTIVYKGSQCQNVNLMQEYLCNFDGHKCGDFGLEGCFMDAVIIFKLHGDICITTYDALKDDIKSGNYVEIFGSDGDLVKQIKQYEVKDGGVRFHGKTSNHQFSPGDFLKGEHQSPGMWENEEQLDLFNPQLDFG